MYIDFRGAFRSALYQTYQLGNLRTPDVRRSPTDCKEIPIVKPTVGEMSAHIDGGSVVTI